MIVSLIGMKFLSMKVPQQLLIHQQPIVQLQPEDGMTLMTIDISQVHPEVQMITLFVFEAHNSGAWRWSSLRKRIFANTLNVPEQLIAVGGDSNSSKAQVIHQNGCQVIVIIIATILIAG